MCDVHKTINIASACTRIMCVPNYLNGGRNETVGPGAVKLLSNKRSNEYNNMVTVNLIYYYNTRRLHNIIIINIIHKIFYWNKGVRGPGACASIFPNIPMQYV